MSDPSETGGRPLASNIQQPEGSTSPPALGRKRRRSSQSSDDRVGGTQSTSSRRRPGSRREATFGPHVGSSRRESSTMQRSTSPTRMSPDASSVNYTRTGRISKAKKGLKVHNCECGRSYTRAEHLRRHQKNHAQDALVCEFPDCGKTFFRLDLLQRHQERHNEIDRDSRRPSFISQGTTAEQEAQVSAPVSLPPSSLTQASPYYQQTASPLLESTPDASTVKRSYTSRNQTSATPTLPVAIDGLQTAGISWNESFSQSPNYSSSSGYASPVPGANDYANMFAQPPYSNRTRTSSNASFIEPWGYPSRSPTSATSTMAYTWTSNDKNTAPHNLAFMTNSSYPMANVPMSAGVDPMSGYMPFGPKSMAQRDEEEQAFLFPEQSFGMGQIAITYPCEQYLNNYWRLFHPSFPVIHRATLDGINEPPMLRAAIIAIGAQYTDDPSAKRKSRILHDRCLKLLHKRDMDLMTEPERLADYQALFLIEVLSQYRARRAARTLSNRFEAMYQKCSLDFRFITSSLVDILSSLSEPENLTFERWNQWINLSSQQRLLLCCYVLESQQATLLARQPQPSLIQTAGFDLPFPAAAALWDAPDAAQWAMAARQYSHFPTYIYEVTSDLNIGPLDTFQSSVLIATHYNHSSCSPGYLSPSIPTIDHLLDNSPITKHQLLTAKLIQVTPIRALLAVSGESWILSEKVASIPEFSGFKATLRSWVNGLWTHTPDAQGQPVKDALKWGIEILQHAMLAEQETLQLELGPDMGLFYAALVIWAVTVAANTRINPPQVHGQAHRYPSHSPLPSNRSSGHYPSTPTHLPANTSRPSQSPNPIHPGAIGLLPTSHTSPALPPTPSSMLHSDITMTSVNFLSNAIIEIGFLDMVPQWPRDVAQWQQGCAALMRWVKMRLRNSMLEPRDSVAGAGPTSAGTGRGGDELGEILDGVIGVLERVMGRGWEGWGV